MATQYAPRTFLRQTSIEFLQAYFQHVGVLQDLSWSELPDHLIDIIHDGWQSLPDAERLEIERTFEEAEALASEEGIKVIIDEGTFHGLELASELEPLKNYRDKAMYVAVTHPRVFKVAGQINPAHSLPRRYWRHRGGMPNVTPNVAPDAIERFQNAISAYFRQNEGRGHCCTVDPYLRLDRYHYLAAQLLGKESFPLPLPNMKRDYAHNIGLLSDAEESALAAAVLQLTNGMTYESWKLLDMGQRIPWLEQAVKKLKPDGHADGGQIEAMVIAELTRRVRAWLSVVTAHDVVGWPPGLLARFEVDGILAPAGNAKSITCDACSDDHVKSVQYIESPPGSPLRAYITCPEIIRVSIPLERLRTWEISAQSGQSTEEMPGGPVDEEAVTEKENVLQRCGDSWTLTFKGKSVVLSHLVGLFYISRLLREPKRDITAVSLWAARTDIAPSVTSGSLGPMVDDKARKEYIRGCEELEEELAEAAASNEIGRMESIQKEKEWIEAELIRGTGLGGRVREQADAERIRGSVSMAIIRAIKKIREHHEAFATHLESFMSSGTTFCYAPDSELDWLT
ncbi:MAG: hypothetical protein KDA66_11940 [Planctomycetaceae bacterium]|nr:hypothetical protein [Planctomycetaceae bacterium]